MKKVSLEEAQNFLVTESEVILIDQQVEINTQTPLGEMGFDSMNFIDLLISVEKSFGIKLLETKMTAENMHTLESLAKHLVAVCSHR